MNTGKLSAQPVRILVSVMLAMLFSACTVSSPTQVSSLPSQINDRAEPAKPSNTAQPVPSPIVPADILEKATSKATSALSLSETAVTPDDWKLTILQWQRAISFLQQIPRSHASWVTAQKLLPGYQQELERAQRQLKASTKSTAFTSSQEKQTAVDTPFLINITAKTANLEREVVEILKLLNQQQTTFFLERKQFAANLTELGSKITADSASYTYAITRVEASQAIATATAKQSGLASYTGIVFARKDEKQQDVLASAICVTQQPSNTPPEVPKLVNNQPQCSDGSKLVEG